ncbi:hypothetical protein Sste5346_003876 [Sporothrix stenoceras]|uniref:Uncharacterized protein n=1 Tax=Sporothrix stenoceras TaxID=5173 RepID=A0ABR3ZAD9_9PEZI
MAPPANKPTPSQTAGRPKNARAAIVPVIPLPLVQKQQLQRQQKLQEQERLKQQQLDLEKKQKEEQEKKEQELKKKQEAEKQKENKATQEAAEKPKKDTGALNGDDNHKNVASPAVVSTTVDKPFQLASTSTPQTVVDASTSVSSPTTAKTPGSSTNTTQADPTAAPFVPPTTTATGRPSQSTGPIVSGASQPHIAAGPSSAGLPPNGHAAPDFVFPPHSRSGSAARQRGPPRHNPQLPPHSQHPLHPQHHAHGFHQPHPSASSITFGAFHDSNNVSPVPTGHGPLPPPPGLIAGPQFVPYNMQNMGPGEWQGPASVPLGDVNGFTPQSAGFNPSTPGSFHGSQSPDNVTDGPAFQHQGGAIPHGGPNGHLPLRNNDSMSMMSPPFFQPSGFPNAGPHERHGGRDDVPSHGFDFQFVHHLQQQLQHSFDNPQTSDCHLILHVPKANANPNNGTESNGPEQQQQQQFSTTMFAGHRNILVQSQSIGHLLRSDVGTMHSGPFNQPILALHMKIDDPYITVDAAVQALRSLYGHPLADVQSVDKALANLTAGFVLMLDHVESVGAEQASRLIGWDTIEKVLAYVLNGASFPNTADGNTNPNGPAYAHADLRYGRGAGLAVRRLLSQAVDFVVRNFPTAYVLNTATTSSTGTLSTLLRFPLDTTKATAAPQATDDDAAKTSSNGTFAHLRSAGSVSLPVNSKKCGPRSPKIVFGGFADESSKGPPSSINGVLNAANNEQTDVASILSRILVNLPYDYLKYVLGHPQLTADRLSITRAVIEEREGRRLQALNAIHAGAILNNSDQRNAILGRLQRPTPPHHRDHPVAIDGWDVLGWKEFSHGETGELVRVWAHADASR